MFLMAGESDIAKVIGDHTTIIAPEKMADTVAKDDKLVTDSPMDEALKAEIK